MRLMLERYSGERGFTGLDVEHVVGAVCACNVTAFFDAHVRGSRPIPFDDTDTQLPLGADAGEDQISCSLKKASGSMEGRPPIA